MEIIVTIVDQQALQEREYDNKNTGQREKFATMGFLLRHADCTFFCEMVQEQARRQTVLDRNYYYVATVQAQARPWQDQQGATRYENRLTLTKLAPL